MQHALIVNAVHSAAAAGSQCKSFKTNVSSSDLSASTLATQVIQQLLPPNSGITTQQINTYIVICPLNGSSASRQTTPLSQAANTSANVYNFEVTVQAQIRPLFVCPTVFFSNVPGLTGPIITTIRSDSFFENTQGLTQ